MDSLTIELRNFILNNKTWSKKFAMTRDEDILKLKKHMIAVTQFLPADASTSQRGWHVAHDVYEIPMCELCQTVKVKYQRQNGKYSRFCSKKCSANAETSKAAVRKTSLDRYGVDHPIKLDKFKQKMFATNLEKYGSRSTLGSLDVRDKVRKTMIERYGVEKPFDSLKIRQLRENTMMEKYGTIHALQNKTSKRKMANTMLLRYGTRHALNDSEFKTKSRNTTQRHYARDCYQHRNISINSLNKLADPMWLRSKQHDEKLPITEIAKLLDVSPSMVSTRMGTYDIKTKIWFSSIQEKEIQQFLIDHSIQFQTNIRSVIKRNELDIYVPEHNLAIEFNGLYWHSEIHKETNYHRDKMRACNAKGIRLIQILQDEWVEKRQLVEGKILHILNASNDTKLFSRKAEIVAVPRFEKIAFLNNYHIQGDGASSVNYGLEYDNELVACIAFMGKADGTFILNRYATSCTVVGGFTRLLKHFEREYNYPKIITFADLRWSQGDLYYKSGFTMDKELPPNYYWCKDDMRWHKFNFRHKGMKTKLEKYDPNLSESENMHNHGFFKVYDAGKLRFVKNG